MNGIRYVKCEVCEKQDEITKLLICGGCYQYLCPPCRILVNKIINRFMAHLRRLPFDVVVGSIMKRSEPLVACKNCCGYWCEICKEIQPKTKVKVPNE